MGSRPSRTYRLGRDEGTAEGMRRIALGRSEIAAEHLREARRVDDPSDCIHAARKDLKKLRAAIRLLRHELGEQAYRAENARYREAGRLLAPSRDAEVKLETLEGLRERLVGRLPAGEVEGWLEDLRRERDAALEAVREGSAIEQALALIEEGGERIAIWPLGRGSWKLVGPGIDRAYRRGRKAMRKALEDPSGERLHRWRKRVKDLWYHLRILRDALPASRLPMIDLADDLADLLGDHHDLAVLRDDLLRREPPAASRTALAAAIAERQEELVAAAFDLGRRLYAIKPKDLRRELRGGWEGWRKSR